MRTKDRATVWDRSLVHTEHPLGEKQSLTREGFLLCRDVPIARIGTQEYLNDEIADAEYLDDEQTERNPLWDARSKNGVVQVDRPETEVFKDEAIASFEGKDVVDDHPDVPVDSENYEQHTVGVTLNPRRGEGAMSEFLIADLLIKKASAIAAVRAGKREVSGGYDADYRVLGPGRAQQFNIIGNHVALVDRGRCGFRCAIGDKEPDMNTKTKDKQPSLIRRVLDAMAKKDRKALEKAMDEMEEAEGDEEASEKETMNATGTHIHLHLGGEESAAGKDPATAGAADEGEEEAEAGASEGASEGENGINQRLIKLESAVAQIAEALRKLAGRSDDAEEKEEAEADAAQEGEEEAEGDDPETDEAETEEEPKEKDKAKDKKGKDVAMTGKKGLHGGKGLDKAKTKDAAVRDSTGLKDAFAEAKSGAEILSPGLSMPTYDSKAPAKLTQDGICLLKRRALASAMRDEANGGKEAVTTMLGKKPLAGMDCETVDTVFNGSVALMKDRNSKDDAPRTISEARGSKKSKDQAAPKSIAELNAANRAHFKQPVKN